MSDSVALPLIITTAGRQAAIDAEHNGLKLELTEIALGSGLWSPDASATALKNEIKRLDNLGGVDLAADMLHLTITDDSSDDYLLGEFGLYSDSGVLFALYSQAEPISEKITESMLMLSADIKLDTVPPGSVTIAGNNFYYPPATPDLMGVMYDAPNDGKQYGRKNGQWEEDPPVTIGSATPTVEGVMYDAPRDDKKYARKNGGWTEDIPVGLPIGSMIPYSGKTAPMGWLWIEPVTIYQKADYPALYAHFQTHCPHLIIDDSTFRLAESRGMFLRGYDPTAVKDPDGADRDPLTEQGDAIRNIEGSFANWTGTESEFRSGSGAFTKREKGTAQSGVNGSAASRDKGVVFDASLVVPTSTENRTVNLNALWIIKAYDAVLDPEQLQAKAVIDQVNANAAELVNIQSKMGYALLDFGTVTKNSRYVKPNPFANNTPVIAIAEIFKNNKWAGTGFVENGGGNGVNGYYVQDEGIVIQTGTRSLTDSANSYGGGHGGTGLISSANCRVHVWRVKG